MFLTTFIRKCNRIFFVLKGIPYRFLTLFISRQSNIWVFGNIQGYRDNSRYLFEYVLYALPDIRAIWIANNQAERDKVEDIGGESILRKSFKTKIAMASAKVGIVCVGMRDIAQPITKNMLIVNLFHGNTLKKLGLDTQAEMELIPSFSFLNKLNHFLLKRSLNRYDIIIAASKLCQGRFSSSFGIPISRIPICGQPRVDIFHSGCCQKHEIEDCKSLPMSMILYAPTWRETGLEPSSLLNYPQWNEKLAQLHFTMVIKLHPLAKHDQKGDFSNILFIKDEEIEFTHLLSHAKILISDYSGAITDYALLGRPILLFTPDLSQYSESRGLYEPIQNFGKDIIFYEEDQLLNAVEKAIVIPSNYKRHSNFIGDKYNDFFDGKNCKRTIEVIILKLKDIDNL